MMLVERNYVKLAEKLVFFPRPACITSIEKTGIENKLGIP